MADEIKCETCDGTGVRVIKHAKPGKRTIARCTVCEGKGRIRIKKAERTALDKA